MFLALFGFRFPPILMCGAALAMQLLGPHGPTNSPRNAPGQCVYQVGKNAFFIPLGIYQLWYGKDQVLPHDWGESTCQPTPPSLAGLTGLVGHAPSASISTTMAHAPAFPWSYFQSGTWSGGWAFSYPVISLAFCALKCKHLPLTPSWPVGETPWRSN